MTSPMKLEGVIDFAMQYGGNCRDCADEHGVCPNSGLPCDGRERAVSHVVRAIVYGVQHNYLPPILPASVEMEPDGLVALLRDRDGSEFDGEVHLSSDEAAQIVTALLAERAAREAAERERDEARAREQALWDRPDMRDPAPDTALADWLNNIPYRGEWVVPGVLVRLIERARNEGAEAAEAKIAEAMVGLEPFATYLDNGGDLDNHGTPLPDSACVGWVYLTIGDFRRARSLKETS